MAKYNIVFKKSAEKELNAISNPFILKIIQKIKSLETNPRSSDSLKLTGYDLWRVRQGDYRIVYLINDEKNIVEIYKIGHRKEIYRF